MVRTRERIARAAWGTGRGADWQLPGLWEQRDSKNGGRVLPVMRGYVVGFGVQVGGTA